MAQETRQINSSFSEQRKFLENLLYSQKIDGRDDSLPIRYTINLDELTFPTNDVHKGRLPQFYMVNMELEKKFLKNKEVMRILSEENVRGTIERYEPEMARLVGFFLAKEAVNTTNPLSLSMLNGVFSSQDIVRGFNRLKDLGADGKGAALWTGYTAMDVKEKTAISKMLETIAKYKDINKEESWLFNGVGNKVNTAVACWLHEGADNLLNREDGYEKRRIGEMFDVAGSDDVVRHVRRLGDSAAYWAIRSYWEFKDREQALDLIRSMWTEDTVNFARADKENVGRVVSGMCRAAQIGYAWKEPDYLPEIMRVIDVMRKEGLGSESYHTLIDIVESRRRKGEKLVTGPIQDKRGFEAVALYLKSFHEFPKPSRRNIRKYVDVSVDFLKKKYGIKKDISMDQAMMFLSCYEHQRRSVARLTNKSEEENAKHYSVRLGDDATLNFSKADLLRNSIIAVVGSRYPEREREAMGMISKIVGTRTINRARNKFWNNHKHLIKQIAGACNKMDYEEAHDILVGTGEECIHDVLNANAYEDLKIENNGFVKAVESMNPLDYDERTQLCCSYLPEGEVRKGIFRYCKDDNFVLVRYDIGGKTVGSAICYAEGDKFLVDSVEGHRLLRKDGVLKVVYKDLINRARERGAEIVVFGREGANETSKMFLRYVRKNRPSTVLVLPASHEIFGDPVQSKNAVPLDLKTKAYLETKSGRPAYAVKVDLSSQA